MIKRTYIPKPNEIERKFYLVDANNQILGRLAAKVAAILRGKHKAIYTRHLDTGDTVIVINADKIKVTGKKLSDKVYHRFTGYPSGQRSVTLEQMLKKAPTEALRLAINRMIPKGPLGYKIRGRLRIYVGDQHPHQAQKPITLSL